MIDSICLYNMATLYYYYYYYDYNILYPHDSDAYYTRIYEWSTSQKSLFISGKRKK